MLKQFKLGKSKVVNSITGDETWFYSDVPYKS